MNSDHVRRRKPKSKGKRKNDGQTHNTPKNQSSATKSLRSSINFLPFYNFIPLLLIRILSGIFNIISDCDETYNYWEPTSFLLTDYGMQTWEYSPEYGLRSYAYLLPQFLFGKLLMTFNVSNIIIFYSIRIMLSLICFICEYYFTISLHYWFDRSMFQSILAQYPCAK